MKTLHVLLNIRNALYLLFDRTFFFFFWKDKNLLSPKYFGRKKWWGPWTHHVQTLKSILNIESEIYMKVNNNLQVNNIIEKIYFSIPRAQVFQ